MNPSKKQKAVQNCRAFCVPDAVMENYIASFLDLQSLINFQQTCTSLNKSIVKLKTYKTRHPAKQEVEHLVKLLGFHSRSGRLGRRLTALNPHPMVEKWLKYDKEDQDTAKKLKVFRRIFNRRPMAADSFAELTSGRKKIPAIEGNWMYRTEPHGERFYWSGLNRLFILALQAALEEEELHFLPTSKFIYMSDGQGFNDPHWEPVVITTGKMPEKTRREIREGTYVIFPDSRCCIS